MKLCAQIVQVAGVSGGARIVGAGLLLCLATQATRGQLTRPSLRVVPQNDAASVSWTGPGTLQTSTSLGGPWEDLIEAPNPVEIPWNGAQQLFRGISRWSRRAELPEANSEMAVAELNGKIYVLGGYPSSRITVRTVQVYDPALDRWQLTTPLPVGVNHSMAAAVHGRLYVIGGQTDAGSTSFVDSVFEFDPVTTNWTAKAPMPTARSAGAAAVIDGRIYVAGGRPPRGQDFAVFDPGSNRWSTLPNMPTGRNHLVAGAIDGKVYVVGGRLGAGFTTTMTNVLEVFDPRAGSWSTRTPMPTTRGGINGIVAEGCLFVWGGEGPNGVFGQNELYVASSDRWFRVESLPVAVHGVTGAALVNGWIHLPGGGTATGGSSGSRLHQVFWVGELCASAKRIQQ